MTLTELAMSGVILILKKSTLTVLAIQPVLPYMISGLDNESLDSYSMGPTKEGVTIKEYTEMEEPSTSAINQDSQVTCWFSYSS